MIKSKVLRISPNGFSFCIIKIFCRGFRGNVVGLRRIPLSRVVTPAHAGVQKKLKSLVPTFVGMTVSTARNSLFHQETGLTPRSARGAPTAHPGQAA
jgi:hypothetical protein